MMYRPIVRLHAHGARRLIADIISTAAPTGESILTRRWKPRARARARTNNARRTLTVD